MSALPKRAWESMLLLAVALCLVFSLTALDYRLADGYYQSGQGFAGRGNWWLDTFSHVWLKRAAITVLALAWLRVLAGRLSPRWRPGSRRWLAAALAMTTAPALVATLKPLSGVQCPWDLQRYGGAALDHIYWFSGQLGVARGGCFPAGHATSGFGLFGLALLWLGRDRKVAWIVGLSVFAYGAALGWGQQMRGAHFLSHTLWSAWVCWAVCLAVFYWLRPDRETN
ncbi:phosphatase PAP2 family protein [Chitinimonas arctica]|uniref:Phosphatase PAP2 family protein n=1 Tax=Chitinimonas arctica TaxID=2594795 RepID=A0A516SKM3_9NEIS|nr:phosphatase PAP2 family protein [Chitinimonas arctica]QDQ28712.1 phosphatase PAP2 family protein [Chitinimonas arctica]